MREAPKTAGYLITDKLDSWEANFDLEEAIDNAVAAAVAAEREACAKIADTSIARNDYTSDRAEYSLFAAMEIAAAIRARSNP